LVLVIGYQLFEKTLLLVTCFWLLASRVAG
jgi:hypothetical protein